MVALLIGSLIIGVVLQFVTGQTRFASAQTAREEVQQNVRGALEVVASDLRGAIASGIILGEEDELEFMLPRRWGVVCSTGVNTITAAFPNLPGETIPTGAGTGLLVNTGPATWVPALPTRAVANASAAVALTAVPGCGSVQITGDVVAFQLTGTDFPGGITPGMTLALYQLVKYEIDDGTGGDWLYRSNGMTGGEYSMQPLAGPVDASQVGFSYYAGDPASAPALITAPGEDASTSALRMIRFKVRMTSRQALDGRTHQAEQDSMTVQIRN